MCMLQWCTAKDLGQLSAVDHRFRRLSLDERLWEPLYNRAVPPCIESETRACLFVSGSRVADLDITSAVERALDRLLDPAVATLGTEPVLSRALCALANIHKRLESCPHHWHTVIAARGYRWALAVAASQVPRRFGPHLDGSPATFVGNAVCCGRQCRGDMGSAHDPNDHLCGYGTMREEHSCVSGRWNRESSAESIVAFSSGAIYYGGYHNWRRHGYGVIVGLYRTGSDTPTVHAGQWSSGRIVDSRAWHVECGEHEKSVTGFGYTSSGVRDAVPQGIVRAGRDGRIAFCGELGYSWTTERFGKLTPFRGRLFCSDGSTLYDGDVEGNDGRSGRIHMRNGRILEMTRWRNTRWNPQSGGPPSSATTRFMALIYPNGDRMSWGGSMLEPDALVCANGRIYRPSLGWNIITRPTESARTSFEARGVLLQDTVVRLPSDDVIITYHNGVDGILFWPRASSPADVADALDFADHMAQHHGPLWVKCRTIVRLLYDHAFSS